VYAHRAAKMASCRKLYPCSHAWQAWHLSRGSGVSLSRGAVPSTLKKKYSKFEKIGRFFVNTSMFCVQVKIRSVEQLMAFLLWCSSRVLEKKYDMLCYFCRLNEYDTSQTKKSWQRYQAPRQGGTFGGSAPQNFFCAPKLFLFPEK